MQPLIFLQSHFQKKILPNCYNFICLIHCNSPPGEYWLHEDKAYFSYLAKWEHSCVMFWKYAYSSQKQVYCIFRQRRLSKTILTNRTYQANTILHKYFGYIRMKRKNLLYKTTLTIVYYLSYSWEKEGMWGLTVQRPLSFNSI